MAIRVSVCLSVSVRLSLILILSLSLSLSLCGGEKVSQRRLTISLLSSLSIERMIRLRDFLFLSRPSSLFAQNCRKHFIPPLFVSSWHCRRRRHRRRQHRRQRHRHRRRRHSSSSMANRVKIRYLFLVFDCPFSVPFLLFSFTFLHCGRKQPKIQTAELGHSLVRSLVRSYRSLVGK